jgi:hypothetical protein
MSQKGREDSLAVGGETSGSTRPKPDVRDPKIVETESREYANPQPTQN